MPRPEAYALRRQILIWVQHSLLITDGRITPLRPALPIVARAGLSGLPSSRSQPVSVSHDLVICCAPRPTPHLGRASDADHSGRKEGGFKKQTALSGARCDV